MYMSVQHHERDDSKLCDQIGDLALFVHNIDISGLPIKISEIFERVYRADMNQLTSFSKILQERSDSRLAALKKKKLTCLKRLFRSRILSSLLLTAQIGASIFLLFGSGHPKPLWTCIRFISSAAIMIFSAALNPEGKISGCKLSLRSIKELRQHTKLYKAVFQEAIDEAIELLKYPANGKSQELATTTESKGSNPIATENFDCDLAISQFEPVAPN